ncbi:MAG: HPF/RaiA family ribosome-associated protein [bacterium]|nr:HPF/RaiA family ribosome-associated protein [bacterium]
MKIPLQIKFHNVDPSEALEAKIRQKAKKLERFDSDILGCRIVVEAAHRKQRKGGLYNVKILVTVRDGELAANRGSDLNHAHEDVYVAMRDSFNAVIRQLEDYNRQRKNEVKTHEPPPQGRISELHREQDYGRIATMEGRDIYFHRNSVVNADFDKLTVGVLVRFEEAMGDNGPQASTVKVEGKLQTKG